MDILLQTLRSLGTGRLVLMGAVFFGLIGFFIYLTTRLTTPQMTLLYGELETADSSSIVTQLERQNIPYEIRGNGTQVMVPADQVQRVRMSMAAQGLPSGGSIGYEIFDRSGTLGATNFQQNVNLIRALEGELVRTINSLSNVRSSRVHLVLPKREVFSRQQQKPTASIILKMKGSVRLDAEQIRAVQHLVAAAVPGLLPTNISIVDDKGSLLARGYEGEVGAADMIAARVEERRRTYENHMAQTVEKLIEKSIGFGKVRAEVTADVDYDRISTNEETFDPEGQVVRSTQTVEQTASSQDKENAPVTVGVNLPDPNLGGGDGASRTAADNRTEETVNFEISKKVVNHIRDTGVIRRLSIAVLVDGAYELADNGERQYRARSEEEMQQLTALVRSAVGFDETRGDIVEVVNMRFAEGEPEPEVPLELFFGLQKNDMLRVVEILVLSIVAILVILLVVRPLITRAFEVLPSAAGALAEGGKLIADQAAGALAAPPGRDTLAEGEEEAFEELIDIDRVEGRVKASSVKKVGEIVEKHPEESLSIIRAWMYQE